MITKYEIREVSGEEILYLYFNQSYEFSNEFDQDLALYSEQFIEVNRIPFHGNKIYYVVDGMVVKKVDYKHPYYYDPDHYLVNLQLEDQSMIELSLKEYLTSILLSYYQDPVEDEVLKSVCILMNTYVYKKMDEDGFLLSDDPFAYYIPKEEYQEKIPNYSQVIQRIISIIQNSSCLFVACQKKYILPFIHECNSGHTLANTKYPFLSSVKSLWDLSSPHYLQILDYDYHTLSNLFHMKVDSSSPIVVQENGSTIKIRFKIFSIREIKELLHLRSNDISIIVNKNGLRFITKGVGNGLGLSIYGASQIAANGGNAYTILNYYFPKCTIYKNIKELS